MRSFCTNCGSELLFEAKFCTNCGNASSGSSDDGLLASNAEVLADQEVEDIKRRLEAAEERVVGLRHELRILYERKQLIEEEETLKQRLALIEAQKKSIDSIKKTQNSDANNSSSAVERIGAVEEKWVVPSVREKKLAQEEKNKRWSSMERRAKNLGVDIVSISDRRALEQSGSKVELGTASFSEDPSIRLLVAQNPHTSQMTIRRLLSDPDDEVRQAAEQAKQSAESN
jgi:hypothetical protein